MRDPIVCAVMLTRDRPQLYKRAVKCFRNQSYPFRNLLIWDTGKFTEHSPFSDPIMLSESEKLRYGKIKAIGVEHRGQTVGELRNEANAYAVTEMGSDIIVHWDDDDWSHPLRIEEQVALLKFSCKQCVGYRSMLFYEQIEGGFCGAWGYANNDPRYCLGTSLCYHRDAWEPRPFPHFPTGKEATGEDTEWLREIDSQGIPSLSGSIEPRMIAAIHGNNTQYYNPAQAIGQGSPNWERAALWDEYCRERMAL